MQLLARELIMMINKGIVDCKNIIMKMPLKKRIWKQSSQLWTLHINKQLYCSEKAWKINQGCTEF